MCIRRTGKGLAECSSLNGHFYRKLTEGIRPLRWYLTFMLASEGVRTWLSVSAVMRRSISCPAANTGGR